MSRFSAVLFLILVPFLFPEPLPKLPRPIDVRPIVRGSGLIFSGRVLKVDHVSSGSAPGFTRITFQVEDGIRGTRRGQIIEVREWEGLWNIGERYRPGERVVLFLYPPSKLGLTSPVGGASTGHYSVDTSGWMRPRVPRAEPLPPIHIRTFTSQIRRAEEER
jgi:hypothetical protein